MSQWLGFVMANFSHIGPILLAGGLGLMIIVERTTAILFTFPLKFSEAFFEHIRYQVLADNIGEAIAMCERFVDKPVVRVVKEALLRAHQPESQVENGLEVVVSEATEKIQARTGYLATIANVATLLGLFGTILGLVQSFEAVGSANAQQRATLLAAGISTAMNATLMGLGVAIPCMIFYSFLMNRTNKLTAEVEKCAVRMMDILQQRYYAIDDSNTPKGGKNAKVA